MIQLLANRPKARPILIGSLELELMEILWINGRGSVRDVVPRLSAPLAYTTVMTTLDRLYKKGLLDRYKVDRAFVYCPRFSKQQWERRCAGRLVADFLSGPHPSRDLLISCLLDDVGEHDSSLLDELEERIRSRRSECGQRERL